MTKPRRQPTKKPTKKRKVEAKGTALLRRELDVHREELTAQNEELRLANADLFATRDRYARLFDVAPIAYVTLDSSRRIVEANLMTGELLGAPRPTLFGRVFDEFVAISERNAFRAVVARVLGGTARVSLDTTLVTRGDGAATLAVHVEAAALRSGPAAALPQVLLCIADERLRRSGEDARSTLHARTAEAHRLESLRLLAVGIAHDFAEEVAIIGTCSELALRDVTVDSPARSAILEIRDAGRRSAQLTRQLIAFGGRAQGEREDVDLSFVVASVEGLVRGSLGAGVTLILDLARDLPTISGDVIQLRQMVVELVVNAAQELKGRGGTIVVRTRSRRGSVELVVQDDGPGMGPDVVSRIFDPFFSTKPNGRGLGLATVQGNARAHGGTVTVETEIGAGAVFSVILPSRGAS